MILLSHGRFSFSSTMINDISAFMHCGPLVWVELRNEESQPHRLGMAGSGDGTAHQFGAVFRFQVMVLPLDGRLCT
jgi:hypothetical protein